MASTTGLPDSSAGFLCYLLTWISGVIFLIIEKRSRFVRFHAAQSILVFFPLMILNLALSTVPLIGFLLHLICTIISFILWIVLLIGAARGQYLRLPLVAKYADQLAD